MKQLILRYKFLFEELVKRDFKKRYSRTALGMLWSMLSPILQLLVYNFVFSTFFGRTISHYTVYLFAGVATFSYFNEATTQGMSALMDNAEIITHINIPKVLFLVSKNIAALINFLLTIVIFLLYAAVDRIPFHWNFLLILYPICCEVMFNIGMGLILSALFIFFKDMKYIYSILIMLLTYGSALFYDIGQFPAKVQLVFRLNPIYNFIHYIRCVVINGQAPGLYTHAMCICSALAVLALGLWMYKKYNYKFMYYV